MIGEQEKKDQVVASEDIEYLIGEDQQDDIQNEGGQSIAAGVGQTPEKLDIQA